MIKFILLFITYLLSAVLIRNKSHRISLRLAEQISILIFCYSY